MARRGLGILGKEKGIGRQDIVMSRMCIVNGKGGVGKTTISCAMGTWLANKGFKTMVVTTDPAASIGDCLNQDIGKHPKQVTVVDKNGKTANFPNLWALEIDPEYEYSLFYQYMKNVTKEGWKYISQKGAPGLNEMASLFRVLTYLYNLRYDAIIVDTAPTGHTLEMLKLPDTLKEQMDNIKSLMKGVNVITKLVGGGKMDESNKRIDTINGCVQTIKSIMSDPVTTHFNLVCIPEFMALREEMRAFGELDGQGIKVKNVIMNRIQPVNQGCAFCSSRRKLHEHYVKKMEDHFKSSDVGIVKLDQLAGEVVGIDTLVNIGKKIMCQMEELTPLDIKPAYRVVTRNGGFIVYTQLPFVEPNYLTFSIDNNILDMRINFGLHEDVVNPLSFPRRISGVKSLNDNGKLVLDVI